MCNELALSYYEWVQIVLGIASAIIAFILFFIAYSNTRTQLKESQEQYRRLVESAPDTIFVHSRGKIVFVNSAGVKLLGAKSPEQIVGKSMTRFIHPNYQNTVKERILQVEKGQGVPSAEEKYIRLDGSEVDVEVLAIPFVHQGEPAVQTVIRDISERKRLEETKNQFISAITHELRTPLVSIEGYIDYALTGKLGTVPKKIKSSLEVVKEESDRLLNLTNDLLDIRRLESGRFQLNLEPLDFRKVINQCIQEFKPFIEKRNQRFYEEIPDKSLMVNGDRVRLSQIIMNLLNNATKFTPKKGKITLRVEEKENTIQVQILDSGIGIKKEDIERVFEPFAAVKKPTYIKGTGLGLSLTKGLVEAHGGKIWAESKGEGKGSTFTFVIDKHRKKR